MFARLFTDHPASVGESYAEHFGVAGRFGAKMIVGGVGAVVHACSRRSARPAAATPSPRFTPRWSPSATPRAPRRPS